jgi:O-antigen/teichoic acid export membrane protein
LSFIDYFKKLTIIKRLVSILGVDKPIFYTVLGVGWSSIAGVIGIFFIIKYLTIVEQGYWYTFLSLGALTVFAELGFTTIITQFISHEYAHLTEIDGRLYGEEYRLDRTVSLVKFSFKFYLVITLVAFVLLSIIGLIFLMTSTKNVQLLMAWVLYSFTGAFMLLVSLFGSILKGFNKVEGVQKIITLTGFASTIVIWYALYASFSLWALAIGGIVNIILSLILFFSSSRTLWSQIFRSKVTGKYNWLKETLPLQWRYALSWTSGYFIFQFMVPVAMFYVGAATAGKLGLALVMVRTLQSMASSWGMTKVPHFNILVAQKKRNELDNLFNTIQWQSLFMYIIVSIAFILIVIFIFPIINWNTRILPVDQIIILLLAEGVNLIIFNWAYYLRSHKQEPFMRISVLSAILTAVGVWVSFYLFSSTFYALCGYLAAQLIILLPARRILIIKRKEYEDGKIGY